MGNHHIDCDYCGRDTRGLSGVKGCYSQAEASKCRNYKPPAQGTEARQGRDACGSVHDGPVANGDAPSDNPLTETKEGSEHV